MKTIYMYIVELVNYILNYIYLQKQITPEQKHVLLFFINHVVFIVIMILLFFMLVSCIFFAIII